MKSEIDLRGRYNIEPVMFCVYIVSYISRDYIVLYTVCYSVITRSCRESPDSFMI